MRKRISNICRILTFLSWFLIMIWLTFHQEIRLPGAIRRQLSYQAPLVITEDREYFACTQKVQVADPYVYVLYDPARIIKVYKTNGEHHKTFIFAAHKNGGSDINAQGNTVYFTNSNDLHAFVNGEYSHRIIGEERRTEAFNNQTDSEHNVYFDDKQSIFRLAPDGTVSVFMERSQLYFFCSVFSIHTLLFLCFALFGVLSKRIDPD